MLLERLTFIKGISIKKKKNQATYPQKKKKEKRKPYFYYISVFPYLIPFPHICVCVCFSNKKRYSVLSSHLTSVRCDIEKGFIICRVILSVVESSHSVLSKKTLTVACSFGVSVWVYSLISSPFPHICVCVSQIKKKKKTKTNFRLWLPLLRCNSIDTDQHTVFQTNNITKKGNPKGSEKIELYLFSATAKTEKHCSSSATTGNLEAV